MKYQLLSLIMVALLCVSCGKSEEKDESVRTLEGVVVMPGADTDTGPLPPLAYTLGAQINFYDFTFTEAQKMNKAIEIIKLVIATDEFRSRVLNHTYNGKKTFVDNGGFSNAEIYQKILDGAEELIPIKNNIIDAQVELYYENNNTVGYTYSTSKRIWVNRKYFNSYTSAGVAHNLFHEWMHKLGFQHAVAWSPSRAYSVPYSLGYLVGEIGKDFL